MVIKYSSKRPPLLPWRFFSMAALLALSFMHCDAATGPDATYVTTLAHTPLGESSGLCPSHRTAGVYWTHNDGSSNKLFAFNPTTGAHVATVTLQVSFTDFEDLASATVNGINYILAADTGNNTSPRTTVRLYVFEEPAATTASVPAASITRINIDWSTVVSGTPPDCEAVALSPTGEIYLCTKHNPSVMYVFKSSFLIPGATNTLEPVATLAGVRYSTGLDISPDGKHMVVLYDPNNLLLGKLREYTLPSGRSSWTASDFASYILYSKATTDGPQVEAVCYSANMDRFYTTTEDGHNSSGSGSCKLYQVIRAGSPLTSDTTAPSAPSSVVATALSTSQISISWTASTDNVGVTGYLIYRNGGTSAIATVTSGPYTDSSLATSTTYTYTVRARDAAGNISAASATATATTDSPPPDTTPPSAPSGFGTPAVSTTTIALSWTASTDNVGIAGYDIYRAGVLIGTSITPRYTDSGLTAGTTYSYTIKARDAAGNLSAFSSPQSVQTLASADVTPPSVPSGVNATALSDTAVTISWTASTDAAGIANYTILRNGVVVGTTADTTFTDTGLTASTSYAYTVQATDASNNTSVASSPSSVTTPEAAPQPIIGDDSSSCGMGGFAALASLITLLSLLRMRPFPGFEKRNS